jgi:hypothetical protein
VVIDGPRIGRKAVAPLRRNRGRERVLQRVLGRLESPTCRIGVASTIALVAKRARDRGRDPVSRLCAAAHARSSTASYGVDGNDDGRTSVYDPADAIPAAARDLAASGAPYDHHAALFAYNHAEWYVAEVLAKAAEYRGSPTAVGDTPELDSGVLSDVLHDPRIALRPIQQSDLRSGAIDPRSQRTARSPRWPPSLGCFTSSGPPSSPPTTPTGRSASSGLPA